MSRHPIVKWAQRSDVVFITIELPDAKGAKLDLEPEGKFLFTATSGAENVPYEVAFDLYDKIDVEECKTSITPRSIHYLVKKVESKWWSRLLKNEGKAPVFLKVDWDKWVDEDEEDEKSAGPDMGDFGMGGMGGMGDMMGGMGGMGGMMGGMGGMGGMMGGMGGMAGMGGMGGMGGMEGMMGGMMGGMGGPGGFGAGDFDSDGDEAEDDGDNDIVNEKAATLTSEPQLDLNNTEPEAKA